MKGVVDLKAGNTTGDPPTPVKFIDLNRLWEAHDSGVEDAMIVELIDVDMQHNPQTKQMPHNSHERHTRSTYNPFTWRFFVCCYIQLDLRCTLHARCAKFEK